MPASSLEAGILFFSAWYKFSYLFDLGKSIHFF
jgi:hypothetical protein